jgi:hypothetical protein
VFPPYSGIVIVDALQKCFVDWGIEDKVFTMTIDNARANDVTIRILEDDFLSKDILPIEGRLFLVRCYGHIINLLV